MATSKSLSRAAGKDAMNVLGYIQRTDEIDNACGVALRETERFGNLLANWAVPARDIKDARNKTLEAVDAFGRTLEGAQLTEETRILFGLKPP